MAPLVRSGREGLPNREVEFDLLVEQIEQVGAARVAASEVFYDQCEVGPVGHNNASRETSLTLRAGSHR